MRRIFLVIPIAAAVIAGLVLLKLTRQYEPQAELQSAAVVRPAPLLKLYDQNSELVRLKERYIGRTKLLIVFYDGTRGPEASPVLTTLRERYADVHAAGAAVLAISAARPSENRYGKTSSDGKRRARLTESRMRRSDIRSRCCPIFSTTGTASTVPLTRRQSSRSRRHSSSIRPASSSTNTSAPIVSARSTTGSANCARCAEE